MRERAHTNIAVVKYWGKHPKWEDYFIPTKSSLSFTVADLYTETEVHLSKGTGKVKELILNGKKYFPGDKEHTKVQKYVDRLASYVSDDFGKYDYNIASTNNFPTAAGFASSASGFAALARALLQALADEHGWAEEVLGDERKVSAVARMGSGSASRSVGTGIRLWKRGWDEERFDPVWGSFSERVAGAPENIVLVYVTIKGERKKVSSSEGMKRSVNTCPFYWEWVEKEEREIAQFAKDIATEKWEKVFPKIIQYSNNLHAVCRSTYPPIEYLTDNSISLVERCHQFIEEHGDVLAYTFDAGPNAVLIMIEDVLSDAEKDLLGGYEYVVTRPI